MKLVWETQHADSESEQTSEVRGNGCGNRNENYIFRCMFIDRIILTVSVKTFLNLGSDLQQGTDYIDADDKQ